MKYAVLFGSPHKNGNTKKLCKEYLAGIDDENVSYINAYDIKIEPCMGCGLCENGECPKSDFENVKMIYDKIREADVFILASPVYFNSVPAPLKCIIDRMQPYYIKRFVKREKGEKKENGVLLMCGGEKEREGKREMLKNQMKYIFDVFGFEMKEFIYNSGTDEGNKI